MDKGIVYIAFGTEYDRLAAHTIAFSKKFLSLPVSVMTNMRDRHKKWEDIPDIDFIFLDLPTDDNREIKTRLYKYTPYEQTIYLDCDCVVIKPGLEKILERLQEKETVFQHYGKWREQQKYYSRAAKILNTFPPTPVFLGGFWAFRKTPAVEKFFDTWHDYWIATGRGRDMPGLACAIKNTAISHSTLSKIRDRVFSYGIADNFIVIHRVGLDDLFHEYGIPKYIPNKPFDIVY